MSQVHKERRVVAERGVCWGEKEQNSVTMAWRHVDASGERAESGGGGETQGRGSGRRAAGTSARPPQAPNRIQTASTPHPPRSALRRPADVHECAPQGVSPEAAGARVTGTLSTSLSPPSVRVWFALSFALCSSSWEWSGGVTPDREKPPKAATFSASPKISRRITQCARN